MSTEDKDRLENALVLLERAQMHLEAAVEIVEDANLGDAEDITAEREFIAEIKTFLGYEEI